MKTPPKFEDLDRISRLLDQQPDILFATVFGSMAKGTARADSDIDVGVLTREPMATERKRKLVEALATASGRPVDLVDFNTAGVLTLQSALLRGKRVVCKDRAAYAALISRALVDAADFLPFRERLLKQRRAAWTS